MNAPNTLIETQEERGTDVAQGKEGDRVLAIRTQNVPGSIDTILGKCSYVSMPVRSFSFIETEDPDRAWMSLHVTAPTTQARCRVLNQIRNLVNVDCAEDVTNNREIRVRQHIRARVHCLRAGLRDDVRSLFVDEGGRIEHEHHTLMYGALTASPLTVHGVLQKLHELAPGSEVRVNPPLVDVFDVEKMRDETPNSILHPKRNLFAEAVLRRSIVVTGLQNPASPGAIECLLGKLSSRGCKIHSASKVEVGEHPDLFRLTIMLDGCSDDMLQKIMAQAEKMISVVAVDEMPDPLSTQHSIVQLHDVTSPQHTMEAIDRLKGKVAYRLGNNITAKLTGLPS